MLNHIVINLCQFVSSVSVFPLNFFNEHIHHTSAVSNYAIPAIQVTHTLDCVAQYFFLIFIICSQRMVIIQMCCCFTEAHVPVNTACYIQHWEHSDQINNDANSIIIHKKVSVSQAIYVSVCVTHKLTRTCNDEKMVHAELFYGIKGQCIIQLEHSWI